MDISGVEATGFGFLQLWRTARQPATAPGPGKAETSSLRRKLYSRECSLCAQSDSRLFLLACLFSIL